MFSDPISTSRSCQPHLILILSFSSIQGSAKTKPLKANIHFTFEPNEEKKEVWTLNIWNTILLELSISMTEYEKVYGLETLEEKKMYKFNNKLDQHDGIYMMISHCDMQCDDLDFVWF